MYSKEAEKYDFLRRRTNFDKKMGYTLVSELENEEKNDKNLIQNSSLRTTKRKPTIQAQYMFLCRFILTRWFSVSRFREHAAFLIVAALSLGKGLKPDTSSISESHQPIL